MAINLGLAKWYFYVRKKYNIDFMRTAMLGRQKMLFTGYQPKSKWKKELGKYLDVDNMCQSDEYSENFWRQLGAKEKIDSIDYDEYENATVIMDLNKPLPEKYCEAYDVVIDGGTLEHIFNYSQGLRNAMSMVRRGGWLLLATPTDNNCNHGFYQLSPQLFYSILTEKNGYELKEMSIVGNPDRDEKLYYVSSDCIHKIRYHGAGNSHLYIAAQRIGDIPDRLITQQQSYEQMVWTKGGCPAAKDAGFKRQFKDQLRKIASKTWLSYHFMNVVLRWAYDIRIMKRYNIDRKIQELIG